MTGNAIRTKFLDFFAAKQHTIIASDSLVPKNDPTVLFTTAGMQQFKRQFLGHIDGYTRAASSQKCLRTDDLAEVGKTNFHHTFFEMLGNFSFGDYFKKEAIQWAWEFLTQELKISPDKLWVSVYKEDPEAEKIWRNDIGIPSARLVQLGDKSNFWPAEAKEKGPNGPCGPCSEIFFDYGVNPKCPNKHCNPDCDCGRFSEIWNLVFTQFDRKEGGVLEPLPNKNIDTGMGLERLTAVLQGKKNNFETDLFTPILEAIDSYITPDCQTVTLCEKRIIADHIRAIVFAIADGVVPSNEGRGYVVKKLIIDTTDIALKIDPAKPVIHTLVKSVAQVMDGAYPELMGKVPDIAVIVQNIEKAYIRVRKERLPLLRQQIENTRSDIDGLGALMFTYRDTYGLTVPTILAVMTEAGISEADQHKAQAAFSSLMARQQKQSRASSKMTGDVFTGTNIDLNVPKTNFMGYEKAESTSTILKLYINHKPIHEISPGDRVQLILDRTPFYAEGGGQIGDTGWITSEQGRVHIEDTQKIDDIYIHSGVVEEGFFKINNQVHARIDTERRLAIMRHHTATHLLQAALRTVLGPHVQQQGSLVAEDRLRFDFTHHSAISAEQIGQIETYVNERILRCDTVTKDLLPLEQARKSGALAFFAEKYGSVVRVVSISDYSKEFCGGTHLESTGQIGLFKITTENAIAQGIRRLEAKTGLSALEYISEQQQQLNTVARMLKASVPELPERLTAQTTKVKQLEREIDNLRYAAIQQSIAEIVSGGEKVNGVTLISHTFSDIPMETLRKVSDTLKQKVSSAVILLGSQGADTASLLLTVSDDLVKKGIKADALIKDIAPLINGSGGGRPQLAQAGSKEGAKIPQSIRQGHKILKEKITS